MQTQYYRSRANRKLLGVAAGLADLTGVDTLLVRLALVLAVLVTGPAAIILYLAAGVLADER